MRNKITDLNNHLFAQLEKLTEDDFTPEQFEIELQKTKAITAIGNQIIEAQKLTLDVIKEAHKQGYRMEDSNAGKLFLDK